MIKILFYHIYIYIYIYVYLMSLIKCFVKKKGLNDGFKIIYTVTLSCFVWK